MDPVRSPVTRSRVLVIGLDPYRVPGPWDPKPVADAVEAGLAGLAEAGFEADACLVGLDGTDDIEARVRNQLEAGRGTASSWAEAFVGPRTCWSSSRPSSTWYAAMRPGRRSPSTPHRRISSSP